MSLLPKPEIRNPLAVCDTLLKVCDASLNSGSSTKKVEDLKEILLSWKKDFISNIEAVPFEFYPMILQDLGKLLTDKLSSIESASMRMRLSLLFAGYNLYDTINIYVGDIVYNITERSFWVCIGVSEDGRGKRRLYGRRSNRINPTMLDQEMKKADAGYPFMWFRRKKGPSYVASVSYLGLKEEAVLDTPILRFDHDTTLSYEFSINSNSILNLTDESHRIYSLWDDITYQLVVVGQVDSKGMEKLSTDIRKIERLPGGER